MSENTLAVINLLGTVALGFLVWSVKTFVSSQLTSYAAEIGRVSGSLAKLDELVEIERRLKQAAGGVELAIKRTLDTESLARTKDFEFRERQLAEFYWALYVRLQMDNSIWSWLERVTAESPTRDRKLAAAIEGKFTLPNHRKAVEIIESKIHLVENDAELEGLLLTYVRHVALFEALRASGITDTDPKDVGVPWPGNLFPVLAKQTKKANPSSTI